VIYIAATNLLLDRNPRPSRQPPGFAGMSAFGFLVSARPRSRRSAVRS
jgi:hypothetical protein